MRTAPFFALTLLAALGQPLHAQDGPRRDSAMHAPGPWGTAPAPLPLARSSATGDAQPRPQSIAVPDMGAKVGIGLLTAAGSLIGGAYLGGSLENAYAPCTCDDPGLYGALLGAMILPPLAIPLSVHLAGGSRTPFVTTFGASLLGGAAAVALGAATRHYEITLLGAPLAELIGAVLAEAP